MNLRLNLFQQAKLLRYRYTKISKKLNKLFSHEGNALIEFALVAPILIFLLIGLFEVGIILVIQNALNAAATQAARYGMTGTTLDNQARDVSINNQIFRILDTYSGGIIDPSKIKVTAHAYDTINQADNQTSPGQGGSFGNASQTVTYQVTYPWVPLIPFLSHKTIMLEGKAVTVNEQFKNN